MSGSDEKPGASANGPAWVLACLAAALLGTMGALNFLDGPGGRPQSHTAPERIAQAPLGESEAPEDIGEEREHLRQYALAIERALASSDARQRETAFATLLPELLAAEPAAAVQIYARQPPGEARDAMRAEVVRHWVLQDRESALAWIESLSGEDERRAAALAAVRTLAARAPDQAIAAADRFGVGRDDGSLEHLVQLWAEQDLEAAQRWLAAQPDAARNEPLRQRIARVAERQAGPRR